MKINKSLTADRLSATAVKDDIQEIQKLKQEIYKLQKDTRNLNTQIKEAKHNGNSTEKFRLIQEKRCINNEVNIQKEKLDNLLISDESFNKNAQLKNSLGNKRVADLDLFTVSGFVNSSLKPKQINSLVSKLGFGALLATAFTVVANPAQAGTLTTVNFDEVNVGLEAEDNPLYGGQKIDTLWQQDYGLAMSSSVNELWLYDSSVRGRDNDLLTGRGKYGNIKYDTPEQGKVLIIQEDNGNKNKNKLRPDDHIGGKMTFDFTDEKGVIFDSIGLLDFDEHKTGKIEFGVKFVNDNQFTTFGVGDNFVSSLDILSTDWDGKEILNDNSLREYNFDFGGQKVSEFYIDLPGSGAITGLSYYRETKKFARKVPEPTSILGLAAISGLAASSLKRKRKSSDV